MEKILTAVPYPVTQGTLNWGTICTDHPTWLGNNVPTDASRESAQAFAEAQACGHREHFGVTVVHGVSATAVQVQTITRQLAMCGDDLGPFREIPACHPVGNYLWSESPLWATVTCTGCLTRCGKV